MEGTMLNWETQECLQEVFALTRSREVLICLRVDEAVVPPTPSFDCQCELCDARIWVAHNSPIEPARICVTCSGQSTVHKKEAAH
jgi:hypothetical protein